MIKTARKNHHVKVIHNWTQTGLTEKVERKHRGAQYEGTLQGSSFTESHTIKH